ncbi:radical SAM family heme chaperone HemW [Marinobacterium jannaschii]|uniref:radical SAM family heme chaperone HemW n=1 Tax=Marinobacterium jannaschii TaxID=64970 RepID=UPI0004857525|nr:radical SAM family heme chaperone HemW [Marinobacterium jannaschii]
MIQLPPLSLYIHIPWCIRKCPYCDFNSHAVRDELPEADYITALMADLEQELNSVAGRELQSIFIGGGTPSLFSAEALKEILQGVEQRIPFAQGIEITMEANPGTFEQEKFEGFREAGVNRLSIGIQSFQDEQLKALGRVHCSDEARHAAGTARKIFDNINLDLMHGLPGQGLEQALDDLRSAIALQPDHLSWYQLTIEPNTEFHSRPPSLPVDETLWTIQEQGQVLLAAEGYAQYEISGYARNGKQAVHNLNYWRFGDYLGIGAGAHGKVTLPTGEVLRRWKLRQPKAYIGEENRLSGADRIAPDALPFEFMMNVLRLHQGVDSSLFELRTGLKLETIHRQLEAARMKGLLVEDPQRLQPTQQGRLFLNNLLEMFLE